VALYARRHNTQVQSLGALSDVEGDELVDVKVAVSGGCDPETSWSSAD